MRGIAAAASYRAAERNYHHSPEHATCRPKCCLATRLHRLDVDTASVTVAAVTDGQPTGFSAADDARPHQFSGTAHPFRRLGTSFRLCQPPAVRCGPPTRVRRLDGTARIKTFRAPDGCGDLAEYRFWCLPSLRVVFMLNPRPIPAIPPSSTPEYSPPPTRTRRLAEAAVGTCIRDLLYRSLRSSSPWSASRRAAQYCVLM